MKHLFTFTLSILLFISASANEGMWIPSLLNKMNLSEMERLGMKISLEDIYAFNKASLKDAIVQFGGGCTAEIISSNGLLLTNHHCGYSQIQKNSTEKKNLLKNGFWASKLSKELPNPGLDVKFIIELRDITSEITKYESMLDKQVAVMEYLDKARLENEDYQYTIKAFDANNQFILIVSQKYYDVRLVANPPEAIGKFGGDTDNWVWPRHTGDFSIFRIYASPDNSPAEYDKENVPFSPKKFLKVNVGSKQEGDFTLIYGFPGTTEQHMASAEMEYLINEKNPMRIGMRDISLGVINAARNKSDKLNLMYASKQARISNAHKKWIGQNFGLIKSNALENVKAQEAEYISRAKSKKEWSKYTKILADINKLTTQNKEADKLSSLFIEYYYYGPEFFKFSYKMTGKFGALANEKFDEKQKDSIRLSIESAAKGFFKDYEMDVDKALFREMTEKYIELIGEDYAEKLFEGMSIDEWLELLYNGNVVNEFFYSAASLKDNENAVNDFMNDPCVKLTRAVINFYVEDIKPSYNAYMDIKDSLEQIYVEGLNLMFPELPHWPDANSTLRVGYGQITGSFPRDGEQYLPYTTANGILEKYYTQNPDYYLPEDLVEKFQEGNWGEFAQDGELWVCFTGSNHTTGGNSGSPALNANGELIGLNFDRSWESTMSDVYYDASICRNIMVDIRYVLWVIEYVGDARHLIDEMELVK